MRSLFSELIAGHPSMSREPAEKLTGLDIHYPATTADAHPLVGSRVSGVEQYLHQGSDGSMTPT